MMWLDTLALVIILGLAIFRAVRFWLKDVLIENQRIWVLNTVLGRKPNKFREKIHELLGCHQCLGGQLSWITVAIVAQLTSIPLPGIVWLAVWTVTSWAWHRLEDRVDINLAGRLLHREDKFGPQ